jgi:hypothetical protein
VRLPSDADERREALQARSRRNWGRAAADIDAEFVDRYEEQRDESLGSPPSNSRFPDPAAAMRRPVTQYLNDTHEEAS